MCCVVMQRYATYLREITSGSTPEQALLTATNLQSAAQNAGRHLLQEQVRVPVLQMAL